MSWRRSSLFDLESSPQRQLRRLGGDDVLGRLTVKVDQEDQASPRKVRVASWWALSHTHAVDQGVAPENPSSSNTRSSTTRSPRCAASSRSPSEAERPARWPPRPRWGHCERPRRPPPSQARKSRSIPRPPSSRRRASPPSRQPEPRPPGARNHRRAARRRGHTRTSCTKPRIPNTRGDYGRLVRPSTAEGGRSRRTPGEEATPAASTTRSPA